MEQRVPGREELHGIKRVYPERIKNFPNTIMRQQNPMREIIQQMQPFWEGQGQPGCAGEEKAGRLKGPRLRKKRNTASGPFLAFWGLGFGLLS